MDRKSKHRSRVLIQGELDDMGARTEHKPHESLNYPGQAIRKAKETSGTAIK
jgi:hypothetical protein